MLGGVFVFAIAINKYANDDLSFNAKAYANKTHMVSLYVDGQKHTVSSNAQTVGDVLTDFNINVKDGDVIEPAEGTIIDQPTYNINVYRAVPVVIEDEGVITKLNSGYQSPKQIVASAGLTIYPEDNIQMNNITDFARDDTIGRKIKIDRALPVQIILAGKTYNFRTHSASVQELFIEHGIEVSPEDLISSHQAEKVRAGMRIVINKISQDTLIANEAIEPDTVVNYDEELPIGQEIVKNVGVVGLRQLTYLVKYKDQQETSRRLLEDKIVKDAITKVVVKGKKQPDDIWYRLRVCESGNNYQRNSGNGYYGAYQFELATWWSNGGSGRPDQANPAEQDRIARLVQARRGWAPWPTCSRKLGLR